MVFCAKKPPWLTKSVQNARKDVRCKLMKARSLKTNQSWDEYRTHLKAYKKEIKNSKRSSWKTFCESASSVPENARIHKILKSTGKPARTIGPVYKNLKSKTLTGSPAETLETLIKHHFKTDQEAEVLEGTSVPTNKSNGDTLIDLIYNQQRLSEVIKTMEPLKAPGPDGIQAILLKQSPDIVGRAMINLYKASHILGHIPKVLRETTGILIPKPRKKDYCDPKAYRTITLSSIFIKIQEKLILWHLEHDLNLGDHLEKRQFGFRKGCSTESALHKIIYTIEKRIARKGYVVGTFLDIEGAFDNVSFQAIQTSLNNIRMHTSVSNWILNMVTNRYVTLSHGGATKRLRVTRGSPQGGVLSPFLWNLVVDSLLKSSVGEIPGYLQALADDLVVLCEGNDLEVITERTQKSINSINQWCKTMGLQLSALKTKVILFTWKRKWKLPRPIKVGSEPLELSQSTKFLGVHLDSKLSFKKHIQTITNKSITSLMQCKRAVGPTWGLSPNTCMWIYKTAIRPIMTYASSVWINALNTQANTRALCKVQRLALTVTSGAMPSTPNTALNMITNTPDISDFIRGEAAKGALRIKANGHWTAETPLFYKGCIKSHVTHCNNYIEKLKLSGGSMDAVPKTTILKRSYSVQCTTREQFSELIQSLSEEAITCYTDGSKSDNSVGTGFSIRRNNTKLQEESWRLPDYSNVFQAELAGIEIAVDCMINTLGISDAYIYIFTDSQAAIHCLQNHTIISSSTRSCRVKLNQLAENNHVTIGWLAGHSGHQGNVRADELANLGRSSTKMHKVGIPTSYIKHNITTQIMQDSMTRWQSDMTSHMRNTLAVKDHIKYINIKNIARNRLRLIIQAITGHCALNYHLHKIKRAETPTCEKCYVENETMEHFLGRCQAYSELRREHIVTRFSNIKDVFASNNLNNIIKYFIQTGRFSYNQ